MDLKNYLIYKLIKNKKLIDIYVKIENKVIEEKEVDYKLLAELNELKELGLNDEIVENCFNIALKGSLKQDNVNL